MGRFGFGFGRWGKNKDGAEAAAKAQPVAEQWTEMAKAAQAEQKLEGEVQDNSERQQRKIIKYFLDGQNEQILDEHDIKLGEGDEEKFAQLLRQGEITVEDEETMLKMIKEPVELRGADLVYERIMRDSWQKQLYELVTEFPNDNKQVGITNLKKFLRSETDDGLDMQTPVGFQPVREAVLEGLAVYPQQSEQYKVAMDKLEHNLYGKRFEYYQEFEKLREKAGE